VKKKTSRERVEAAINFKEPDRPPLDIGGGSSTSIVVEGYEQLKKHLHIHSKTAVMSKLFRLAYLDEEVMQILGSDCRPLNIGAPRNGGAAKDNGDTYTDLWGVTWRKAYYGRGAYYYELYQSPLSEATIDDLGSYPWPDVDDPGFTEGLAEAGAQLFEHTDYAVMGDAAFKSFWERGYMLRGFENLLMDLALDPEFVKALMGKLLEINIAVTERYLDAVGDYIHIFRTADDLSTQRGPLFSPRDYINILKPYYKAYFDFIKSKTKAKIFYHSCGNVTELLPELIDAGVDIINPVQVSAIPELAELKKKFKNEIVFWGGVDTQHVLPNGTPDEVRKEVELRIEQLGTGGGFVVAAVHNIQPDVPPENIIAMADTVTKTA
jgi:uroporphyrinogen decarboxylase